MRSKGPPGRSVLSASTRSALAPRVDFLGGWTSSFTLDVASLLRLTLLLGYCVHGSGLSSCLLLSIDAFTWANPIVNKNCSFLAIFCFRRSSNSFSSSSVKSTDIALKEFEYIKSVNKNSWFQFSSAARVRHGCGRFLT